MVQSSLTTSTQCSRSAPSLVPIEVLALAHLAEQDLHRTREVRWGARTLDVDVINYGDVVSDDPVLRFPIPRAVERAVLVPLLMLIRRTLAGTATPVPDLAALPPEDAAGCSKREDLILTIDIGA